ncbi:MAG TPA: hypothetical protein VEC93_14090 [Anaerolineae bacterium]|nr:hypothetical protein [Anaerolineae bacterium]
MRFITNWPKIKIMAKKRTATRKRPVKRKATAKKKKRTARKRVTRKRPVKRKAATSKRKSTRKRTAKKKAPGRTLVKQVERSSVERVLAGKRKRRSRPRKRRVVMAGTRRRRTVGKGGGKGLLIGLGLGALALFLLSKKSTTNYPAGYTNLPPLSQTQNVTRNNQTNNIINYAIAGGLAIDAIIKLIDRLNTSNDNEVQNIYDHVNTTGEVGVWI